MDTLLSDKDSIKLSWSRLSNDQFSYYSVLRQSWTDDGEVSIARIDSNGLTAFTDKTVPISPFVRYRIVGFLKNGDTLQSNRQEKEYPGLNLKLVQVVRDADSVKISWQKIFQSVLILMNR
ncbi:hypothetical protein [Niabella drilacis]|uniref:Uncharacterized protein n=1 Tax=Niabella drilacis (strain DSM 25811 / CCM 8410 / CCUG 62505 / LMG 26954 / E90) TaxID=1285928 RepID=A0A1G6YFE5_NIADE|nr:hypothetical protein [Niabella drilacis]SDD89204.1 hypothetical protein SAMN04487894_115106 [Niabella drilacis]